MAKYTDVLKGICDVCGQGYPFRSLSKQWDGLMACKICFDIKHPALTPARPVGTEGVPPPDIRPLILYDMPPFWYFYDANGTAWNYDDGTFSPP